MVKEIIVFTREEFLDDEEWEANLGFLKLPLDAEEFVIEFVRIGISEEDLHELPSDS